MNEASIEKMPQVELRLFQATPEDARTYLELLTDEGNPEHFSNFDNMPEDYQQGMTVESILENWEKKPKKRWGIYSGNQLVGTINLKPMDFVTLDTGQGLKPIAEIGYLVSKKHSGQRFGTQALRELIKNESANYSDFLALVHPQNTVSARLLRAAGFIKRENLFKRKLVFEWNTLGKELLADIPESI